MYNTNTYLYLRICYLKNHDIIFSNRFIPKISRQGIFIIFFLLYFFYVNLFPTSTHDLFQSETYLRSLRLMIYAPVSIIAVYIAIYVLLPRLIYAGKYITGIAAMMVLTTIYFSLACLTTYALAAMTGRLPYHKLPVSFRWFMPVRYGIGFPVTSTILVIIVKLFKIFYLKQKEHEQLLRQKVNTELQLLKTRFKPQFLYNALQHISSLLRNRSADSTVVLLKLSDLLSYVLYEHEKETVPLENELEILKTFFMLKNSVLPQEYLIRFHQQIKPDQYLISPLLLLSIVENCLDGIHQSGEQPIAVNLIVKTIHDELHFQMECGEFRETGNQAGTIHHRLQQALEGMEVLYQEGRSPDLFTENGATYLILVFELTEIRTPGEERIQIPVLA
jgi:sensor histidine kinase YesM